MTRFSQREAEDAQQIDEAQRAPSGTCILGPSGKPTIEAQGKGSPGNSGMKKRTLCRT